MKKKCMTLLSSAMFFLLLAGSVFAASHSITSTEILSFEDPAGLVVNDPTGSAILSWNEGITGITGGFSDVTVYIPFPDGGKYMISLISVVSSTNEMINGVWDVKKNGTSIVVTLGTATGLNNAPGGIIEIEIDGFRIIIRIEMKIDGVLPPEEISGLAMVDGMPLAGAVARIQGGGAVLQKTLTDNNGTYLFNWDPVDVKRIVVVFKNYDPEIVISGYIYIGGVPLVGATVMIKDPGGTDLAVVTTDAAGYYETLPIINAVGVNLRTIILN